MIDANEYSLRREKLLEKIENNSIVIIFSGLPKYRSADQAYDFEVNRNFYYLTGFDQENSMLILSKLDFETSEYLFIDEKKEIVEKWLGIKKTVEEAKEISGIQNVLINTSFEGKVDALIGLLSCENIYIDQSEELKIGSEKSVRKYADELKEKSNKNIVNVFPLMAELRLIKSSNEIRAIQESIHSTDLALRNVLKQLRPGKYEYTMRNVFNNTVFDDANSVLAFPSIVAAGKNGIILHYPQASDLIKENDLVLFDVGAQKNHYCSDISRTYPANGKYSELQKTIYQIVLDCNKATINFMKPGLKLSEVKEFAKNFLADECVAKGLIESKDKIGDVYYHGVSHHLGLDTHDICVGDTTLVPGMVLTCEPGLYFKQHSIGVRIEDDILITENGSENLSQDILKEVKDIEKYLEGK